MQTSVIRDLGELESISAEWDGLLDRSAGPEVFRTHDWMAAWWEVFGGDGDRQPLVVEDLADEMCSNEAENPTAAA